MGDKSTHDLRNEVVPGVAKPRNPSPARVISPADPMCGFCGKRDKTVRNVKVGIFKREDFRQICPVCSDRYGLPWR